MKSPGENIDFQTTILSRFDMIFIVKDEHNAARDETMARHVMSLHMNRTPAGVAPEDVAADISIERMKRYITYCKTKCAPRLSPDAAEKLSSHFVGIRKKVHQVEVDANERPLSRSQSDSWRLSSVSPKHSQSCHYSPSQRRSTLMRRSDCSWRAQWTRLDRVLVQVQSCWKRSGKWRLN